MFLAGEGIPIAGMLEHVSCNPRDTQLVILAFQVKSSLNTPRMQLSRTRRADNQSLEADGSGAFQT